jgi:hypothetical protein
MKSKNFKNELESNFKPMPDASLKMVIEADELLDLRMVDSSVMVLIDEKQEQVKKLFDKRLF